MYGQQSIRFGPPETPKIVKQLMIANLVVFIAQMISPGISDLGAVRPNAFWHEGYLWQPFTYMWLHGGFAHIAMNCFALWMFGSELAMAWGKKRFLRYYLLCGIGAGFIIASWPFVMLLFRDADVSGLDTYTLGASGAVYGVLLAYSLTWPDRRLMLIFPPVSFRAIWLIPALLVMTVVMSGPEGGISHIGHLGGVLVAWLYLRRHGLTSGYTSSGAPSSNVRNTGALKRRWRRWRMRKRLRAVRPEDDPQRRKDQDERDLAP